MSWGTVENNTTGPVIDDLLFIVDDLRGYVAHHLPSHPGDIEAVLQEVRETVWRKADTYDPDLGNPSRFVFGITRNIVHRYQCRHTSTDELPDELPAPPDEDILAGLVHRFDLHRWISLVADFVGVEEWEIITDLAFESGNTQTIAARHDITPRRLRTVRDHVSHVTYTVRAALAAIDLDLPRTGSLLINCLPPAGGFREAAEHLDDSGAELAERLGIHPGSARSRIAITKRLLTIAQIVLDRQAIL
ncbi:sigma-70 family RNA polymerase sigma factor [Planctomonas sp. JC2975]|uniref:RNA polymerase sigma factor n=1 Tax=Planctomonas sp. JC2975 TaxID=2729626 RepID=UPI001F1127F9|nr:sigma-70 family RNA polymerase sigma factor [Planctomonas sp. JC2975]